MAVPGGGGLLGQTAVGLSEFAPADDRDRLADALTHVRLAAELDAIRLKTPAPVGGRIDTSAVVPVYRKAFVAHGLDTDGDAAAVARRIAGSPAREMLVAVLDDWAAHDLDAGRRDRVTRIAKAADPDPWRDRFRDALARLDRDALRGLAAEADVGRLSPAALVVLGMALGNRTGEGADLLARAQDRHPADYWLNFWLAAALHLTGRAGPAELAGYYRVCVGLRPDAAPAHENLGAALFAAGKHGPAEAAFRRAIELDPTLATAHSNLGAVLHARGDAAGAEAAFRRAIELDPKHPRLHLHLGTVLSERGDLAGAEASFRRAVELDPKFADAHFNLGSLLNRRGDRAGAVAAYRRAVEADAGHAAAHFNLGNALQARGDLAGAEAAYRRAAELDPKNPSVHNNLGLLLAERGDRAGAEAALRRAVEVNPRHARAHLNLGNLLSDRGNLPAAEAAYRRAIEADPTLAVAHFNLGITLRELGDAEGAAAACRRAVELDPKHAQAHFLLGAILHGRGDLAGAEAAYRRVTELNPKVVWAHTNLADVLNGLGRFDEARAAAQRGLELVRPGQPGHAEATARLRHAERMTDLDRRLPAVLRGEDRAADLAEIASLAGLAAARRRPAGAARLYEELFRKDPAAAESRDRRYNAARAAALAGCGRGEDDPAPDEAERARWRRQALDWLRADLKKRAADLTAADPKARESAGRFLQHWQTDPDLAGVRDAAGLAKLPDDERAAWEKFWAEVAAALTPPRK